MGRLHDYWGDGDGFLYFPMLSRPAYVMFQVPIYV